MKTTMKILPLLFGVMLFFTQCEKDVIEKNTVGATMELKDSNCSVTQTLWAGAGQNDTDKGTPVGTVTATVVTLDGVDHLRVVYAVDFPWLLTETHLWVGNEEGKAVGVFPRNAAPGRFPFKANLDYVSGWTQDVNLESRGIYPGDPIYVAAHAVVKEAFASLDDFLEALPETVTFSIVLNEETSYLTTTVSNGSFLDGEYDSYCINPEIQIFQNTDYFGSVYSSITPPDDLVVNPDNFNQVNWIINNITVGDDYSYGDVQVAIWKLLFDTWISNDGNTNVENDSDPDNVQQILDLAGEYEDFVPGCGEYLVIILWDESVQPVIIWKPVPCGGDETAWAYGEETFIELGIARNWGWIFDLDCY